MGDIVQEIYWKLLFIFRRVRKIVISDCLLRRVRPSVRMEQLGSHWTDFHEILFEYFWKFFVKIRV
jgi:hypothetical protein